MRHGGAGGRNCGSIGAGGWQAAARLKVDDDSSGGVLSFVGSFHISVR